MGGGFTGKHMWYYNRNIYMQGEKKPQETERISTMRGRGHRVKKSTSGS